MKLPVTFVQQPALRLVGFSNRFIAAISPDANNMTVIPKLWQAVGSRRAEFGSIKSKVMYGVCRPLPIGASHREDELEYLAGLELEPGMLVPAGAVLWEVPSQFCARFTHVGPVTTFGQTLQEIFGNWFPRSEYEPEPGVEIEIYDEKFKLNAATSELAYLVPCRRRAVY